MSEDATARWVRRLNAAGRELDATAASMHPSARPEAMKGQREAWKRLAKGGP